MKKEQEASLTKFGPGATLDGTNEEGELTATQVGGFSGEGPPVPIPNTAVKLTGADNTWLETAREDR